MESRLRFLLQLVLDYNASHADTRAVFRLDNDTVDIYLEDKDRNDIMFEMIYLRDLTEESVYWVYRKIKETSTTEE